MFGSGPTTITMSCGSAARNSVSGHSTLRTCPSSSVTLGRVCW